MRTNDNGFWTVDLDKMTCRNTETELVIAFEKRGPALIGKIMMLPMKLVQEWARDPECEMLLRKAVIEADEVFFQAYFAREIAKKHVGTQLIA